MPFKMLVRLVAALLLAAFAQPAFSQCSAVDPPRDMAHPSRNQQLLIPSNGVGLNAVLFQAAGIGPHPTVILMHGLPGNERNLDLAQAIRRCGWDVLTFTYRGAWGSPGDFSIANSMEDAVAAFAFARSPEAAKFGIDGRHIVLAGHSMGGATAFMAAASATGLDGLILIDAWNPALKNSKGADTREALAKGFDDFGNSLHSATPETVADEVIAKRSEWNLIAAAPRLAQLPILSVYAKYGIDEPNRTLAASLGQGGSGHLTAIEMDTDHSFTDHRMALAAAVTDWLNRLWAKR